jgi:hypothetical protein
MRFMNAFRYLAERFPGDGLRTGSPPNPLATFPAVDEAVGDVRISQDGDEVRVAIGTITHGHFSLYDVPQAAAANRRSGSNWRRSGPQNGDVRAKRSGSTMTTVAVPDHSELKAGTLSSIIRQSGLSRASFEI